MNNPKHIKAIDDFWQLFPHSFAEKVSDGAWEPYPYLKIISQRIAQMICDGGGNLVVEAPPRHGKSFFLSYWLPIWFLETYPHRKIILTTYEADFAKTFGRAVRNEINENPMITVKIAQDSSSASRWDTTEGGGMITAGIGGPVTGKGGNLLLVDDPVKNWDEASSPTYRKRNIDWMKTTLMTRGEPGAVTVVLMTRWHEQDLAGVMQKEKGWEVLRFPAIAEEDDLIGRKRGDALCPQRYPIEVLEQRKTALGTRFFGALFQQRPAPEEGDIFRNSWWKFYDEVPDDLDKSLQSWDMAFKDTKTSAYVCGQVWGRKGSNIYLIDSVRDKLSFTKSVRAVQTLTAKWPDVVEKLIEEKANGAAIIDTLKDSIEGIIPVNPRGSKEARAYAIQPLVEAGNVWLPRPDKAPWVHEFLAECSTFPNSDYKDQVDAMTQAFDRLRVKKVTDALPSGIFKSSMWG